MQPLQCKWKRMKRASSSVIEHRHPVMGVGGDITTDRDRSRPWHQTELLVDDPWSILPALSMIDGHHRRGDTT